MTNTKAASSLLIPLLLLRRCDVKHLKEKGGVFAAEVKNILFAYMMVQEKEEHFVCTPLSHYFRSTVYIFVVMYNVG